MTSVRASRQQLSQHDRQGRYRPRSPTSARAATGSAARPHAHIPGTAPMLRPTPKVGYPGQRQFRRTRSFMSSPPSSCSLWRPVWPASVPREPGEQQHPESPPDETEGEYLDLAASEQRDRRRNPPSRTTCLPMHPNPMTGETLSVTSISCLLAPVSCARAGIRSAGFFVMALETDDRHTPPTVGCRTWNGR